MSQLLFSSEITTDLFNTESTTSNVLLLRSWETEMKDN